MWLRLLRWLLLLLLLLLLALELLLVEIGHVIRIKLRLLLLLLLLLLRLLLGHALYPSRLGLRLSGDVLRNSGLSLRHCLLGRVLSHL